METLNYTERILIEGFDDEVISQDDHFTVLSHDHDRLKVSVKGKHFDVKIIKFDIATKKATINVDGYDFLVTIKEPLDLLMDDMGFLKASQETVKELKSPMPGLIRSIYVSVGNVVADGDKLLSLEAMKMENIIKSPGTGIIKSINVQSGDAVEKNSILIEFE
jgi:biotin carboxyl carrier protein